MKLGSLILGGISLGGGGDSDSVKVVTLPRLKSLSICPYAALKDTMKLYAPGSMDPLFQCYTAQGWQVMTDARGRKCCLILMLKCISPKIIIPSMLSDVQVPPRPTGLMLLSKGSRGHGGRVVTLSPPTSAAGVRSPSWS